jgi:hypothetical protein
MPSAPKRAAADAWCFNEDLIEAYGDNEMPERLQNDDDLQELCDQLFIRITGAN